jgi:hypothetical protein
MRSRGRVQWCEALRSSKVLGSIVREGKRALKGADAEKVSLDAACSVALDDDGPSSAPGEKRWDYVLVERASSSAHAVEIHTATPGDVKDMIAKKAWAERLLAEECPGDAISKWHWVARTRVDFPKHRLRERELLRKAGIEFPQERIGL